MLFGAGAVLGFFSTLFWIIVGVTLIIGLLLFIRFIPNTFFYILVVIFLFWLIFASSHQSNNNSVVNLNQPQISPTIQQEEIINYKKFDAEGARADGYTSEQIQEYLAQHPNAHVYPEDNRNLFLTNCYKTSENNTKSCNCLLNYFEARYSLDEFAQIDAEYAKNQKSEIITKAVQYCAQ